MGLMPRLSVVCLAMLAPLATVGPGEAEPAKTFRELARSQGEPQVPDLKIVYLHPLGNPADANNWRNIIVHQTEGPAGSAKSMAQAQAKNPTKRGVMVWVETDGTVYWATAETVIPTHGDGANRNENWCGSCRSVTTSRPRTSMRTTGSTSRIAAIARAAIWRRWRASWPMSLESE
jgi:hypothetical protein